MLFPIIELDALFRPGFVLCCLCVLEALEKLSREATFLLPEHYVRAQLRLL